MVERINSPLISVLIPIYNAEDTLEQCVSSVLAQTYSHIEVVLVNDGSTDQSAALCDALAKTDSRIIVLHQKNRGSAAARNTALEYASGEYIAWVDADDFIFSTFLQHLFTLLCTFDARISMCRFEDTSSSIIPPQPGPSHEADCVMDFESYCQALHSIRETEMIVLWNKLYDAELWNGVRFPENSCIDDAFVVWKLVYAAKKIAVSTLPLYFYYMTPQSATRGDGSWFRQIDGLECLHERYTFLKNNGYGYWADMTMRRYYSNIFQIYLHLANTSLKTKANKRLWPAYRRLFFNFMQSDNFGKRIKLAMLLVRFYPRRYAPYLHGQLAL